MSALLQVIKEKQTPLSRAVVFSTFCADKELAEQAAAELAALRAERDALKVSNARKLFRLQYIYNNITDEIAVRFALEASDRGIAVRFALEASDREIEEMIEKGDS